MFYTLECVSFACTLGVQGRVQWMSTWHCKHRRGSALLKLTASGVQYLPCLPAGLSVCGYFLKWAALPNNSSHIPNTFQSRHLGTGILGWRVWKCDTPPSKCLAFLSCYRHWVCKAGQSLPFRLRHFTICYKNWKKQMLRQQLWPVYSAVCLYSH